MPRLKEIFSETLQIPIEEVVDSLEYASDPRWDSVAHMALVAAIDEAYDIMMETEDVLDMSTVAKARTILGKYGVES